jgi:hypothetical protein
VALTTKSGGSSRVLCLYERGAVWGEVLWQNFDFFKEGNLPEMIPVSFAPAVFYRYSEHQLFMHKFLLIFPLVML